MPAISRDESGFRVSHRTVQVDRVEAKTTVVDMNYGRVELCIDGEEYEFSGPDAQVLGAQINTAGGGDMFAKTGAEDTIRRAYRALTNFHPASTTSGVVKGSNLQWIKEAQEILRAAVESYGRGS